MNAHSLSTASARSAGAEPLNAPLFASLIQRIEATEERCVVIDLGAARTETLALFGRFRARLDIVDLGESLDHLDVDEPELMRERVEELLPPRREEAAHLILCWDLLNYLSRPALATFMTAVADRAVRGALAHALIAYSSRTMPVKPACYVPIEEHRLVNVAPPDAERDAPRYSPEDLANCLPGYTVERARLLRNGMQEYLFRL